MISKPIGLLHCLLLGLMALGALVLPASGTAQNLSDLDRYPLSPPDISSPQATLATFMHETKAAVDAYFDGDLELMRARAGRSFQTLAVAFPPTDVGFLKGTESSLQLLEILIRIDLPKADLVPGQATTAEVLPPYWVIPETELRLVRISEESGELVGYRFSVATVERIAEFYQRVQGLPVREEFLKYDGVVERFRLRPGFAAPALVIRHIESLPPAWFQTFGGEPLWKWTMLLISSLFATALFILAYRLSRALDDGTRPVSSVAMLVHPALAIFTILLVYFLHFVVVEVIRLTGAERQFVVAILLIAAYLAVIWLIFIVAIRVAAVVIRIREMGLHTLDAQLVRIVTKLVAVLLALYVLVNLAEMLGVPITPMLAGLGVGGLAVALAVRPTLENIVAGFVLFADAPVRVGEFCEFGGKMGTVESIGLRSVRLRGLDRTVIIVPNAEFCQLQIVNFTRRDASLLSTRLQLRYETTPDQLRLVLTQLRELLIKHPMVRPDPARVRFVEYGESSLDLEVFALVETSDFSEFLAIQEDINLRIKDIVEASGSGFAFPSQTLYLERSQGLDDGLTTAAEAEVERWRNENRLPFPDIDDTVRSELSNTLDYPPHGSPGHLSFKKP